MKNKVVIFVGPPRSGKSIFLHACKEYWEVGGRNRVGFIKSESHPNIKFWKDIEKFNILVFDNMKKKDLSYYLDEIKVRWMDIPKTIFITMNDIPDFEQLKKLNKVQVFKFTPAECVFPPGESIELSSVFIPVKN